MSTTTPATRPPRKQGSLKTLLGTGVGNAVEWYDWNIYASFAVYFSAQLFNDADPRSAFLQTIAVFAVGFVARPFGGFLFGWIGDRIGRKPSLTLSILAASAGSLLIALSPTYEQIGWWASALLLLARLIQGLAHGGELPAAQTYLAEFAPKERRWTSAWKLNGHLRMPRWPMFATEGEYLRDEYADDIPRFADWKTAAVLRTLRTLGPNDLLVWVDDEIETFVERDGLVEKLNCFHRLVMIQPETHLGITGRELEVIRAAARM